MGRLYAAAFDNIAVTAAQDIFELNPASDSPCIIHSIVVGQSSDVGDAEEELLRWLIIRGHATSGSGGGTITPAGIDPGSTAFGGTVERNNTTAASTGSPVTLRADVFNVRTGLIWIPTPEERIVVGGGSRLVVNLPAAPADSLTMSGTLVFEEIG